MKLLIGLMSGTSMDGIDAALVDVSSNTLIAGITRPYGAPAMQCLQDVLDGERVSLKAVSQLNTLLGREFAFAVLELLEATDTRPEQVLAIGSHGQTVCHDALAPIPYTLQLGCAHTIAEWTGITVVADFRTRDLVIGGQGAPFAPIYHQTLFAKEAWPIAVVNIGGIANVTYLTSDSDVIGYDTGPGNGLLDVWVQTHQHKPYDEGGAWAASGKVIMPLLTTLLADPYFKRTLPKSIGKEYFSKTWLERYLQPDYAPADVQATLLSLTAVSIATAIRESGIPFKRAVVCGGGAHNRALLAELAKQLPGLRVDSTAALGVSPDFIEAMMMAWLAEKAYFCAPIDLTKITGAKKSAIYGAIYARSIDK